MFLIRPAHRFVHPPIAAVKHKIRRGGSRAALPDRTQQNQVLGNCWTGLNTLIQITRQIVIAESV